MDSMGPIAYVILVATLILLSVATLIIPDYKFQPFWGTVETVFDQDLGEDGGDSERMGYRIRPV